MEIEAKLRVPDAATYRRLREATAIAGYDLGARRTDSVVDTYLDTEDHRILAAGYALRRRKRKADVLVTIKGLAGGADDVREVGIHHREEIELALPADVPESQWPDGELHARVIELTDGQPLQSLFSLLQTRTTRQVSAGTRAIAEMSLDLVRLTFGSGFPSYRELEIELLPDGTEADLSALTACLRQDWKLTPEPRSKFERALEELERSKKSRSFLSTGERAQLAEIAQQGDDLSPRAGAILALDAGATQAEAGRQVGLSVRRVRYWLAEFRKQGMGIFSDQPRSPADVADSGTQAGLVDEGGCAPAPEAWPIERLLQEYDVDRVHARTVADLALQLFDALQPVHHLPVEHRGLLEIAALLHNVGLALDPQRHHRAGQDILLTHPPAEVAEDQRGVVALTTLLHRKQISAKRLANVTHSPLFEGLTEPLRLVTLSLAALVRMADGLDYSQSAGTRVLSVDQDQGVITIAVEGPTADVDAERANTKSDLWHALFDTGVRFAALGLENTPHSAAAEDMVSSELEDDPHGQPTEPVLPATSASAPDVPPAPVPLQPGLQADDTMAEAARKTLLFHWARMVAHEQGTRQGLDIEELHDMRVATRRMRAALQVFGNYVDRKQYAPFTRALRRTGRTLGEVRDLDVFWEKTQHYLAGLPPAQQDVLEPLHAAWQAERDRCRAEMISYLDSARYLAFRDEFGQFLQTPGVGAPPQFRKDGLPVPRLMRHLVPAVVYQNLAEVRAFDEWVSGDNVPLERLHQLRIASKGLRYALEFFSEVLGTEAASLIESVKTLQDHLGDLQDAVVACGLLRDFLTWGTWGHASQGKRVSIPTELVVAPGVATYLAARQQELQGLLSSFAPVWAPIHSRDFTQCIATALSTLG